ncbi:hypothetical protein DOY81_010048 [Sarcophaga bullata]|nr:hypothetical protein DOY81_010048 [Sarcophaga bullata]
MNCEIFWPILIASLLYCLPHISGNSGISNEICDFIDTVDLTGREKFQNGTYAYDDILILPEQQAYFDYELRFQEEKVTVPKHLRGCACTKRPCAKLCCPRDQFFSKASKRCEKITPDMKVSWEVEIISDTNSVKNVNILEKFTMQIGLPCDEPEAANTSLDIFALKESGELSVGAEDGDKVILDSLSYCYSPILDTTTNVYKLMPYSCPYEVKNDWEFYLNAWSMAISVIFLIPTILVYLAFKELRSNLRGKILICYLISLTVGYATLSFINISDYIFSPVPCSILGFTCYFFFMSAYLWLSVLCYDIWMNFKETTIEFNAHKNIKPFIMYSLYVWLCAGFATLVLIIIQNSKNIDDIYKPDIGTEWCWLNTNRWSAAIYFYGPNLIILIFNLITFTHLTLRIYKVRRNLAKMTLKSRFIQENVMVILRLFLIMGISWIFDILSYCLRHYEEWQIVFIASDVLNAIQGLLIFVLFVLKGNVLKLIKNRFQTRIIPTTTYFTRMQSMASSVQTTTDS